ncbi:MAG TPA: hypothetical protein VEC56_07985 [Candidatus Krumholzibacteria bacterium]|nr:hypothetical protein [Candidatus Krumholzibacteria bacterium]
MMQTTRLRRTGYAGAALLVAAAALMASCGKGKPDYDTNLLVNASFEDVGRDGIPRGWSIENFRGPENEFAIRYGVDDQIAQDGKRSWFFAGDPNTKRFFLLSQEVEVRDATHVRLRGWIQTDNVDLKSADQLTHCNFLLTFYDENHHRFQELRVSDKRTRPVVDTRLWAEDDVKFRLPQGTRFVKVSCVLAMTGQAWFDNVSLEVPTPIDWQTATTKNFVFHWLPGHPMPDGSQAAQQMIWDTIAKKLGLESNVVVQYYFYPDTTTIRSMLSLKGYQYVSWDDVEFHSINANDNHEIVHFMTDPIGRAPRALAEGTVFWLHDDVDGLPVEEAMKKLVRANLVPPLRSMFEYNLFMSIEPPISMPAAASYVGFLVDRFGVEKLMELYKAANGMTAYEGVAQATEKVYGIPLSEIEAAWLTRQRLRASQG